MSNDKYELVWYKIKWAASGGGGRPFVMGMACRVGG